MNSRLFAAAVSAALFWCMSVDDCAAQLVISEFRWSGPGGATDEFIEIYNNSGTSHPVVATSGTGYAIAASDGVTRCTIPNGTVIPAGSYFLCVNTNGYSLVGYPAGNAGLGIATEDAGYTTNIADFAGVALFNNNTGGSNFSVANRIDAAGSNAEKNPLYREGAGFAVASSLSVEFSYVRDQCGKTAASGIFEPCSSSTPIDTNNNAKDFFLVNPYFNISGPGFVHGAPGPQNSTSPVYGGPPVSIELLDPCAPAAASPNFIRNTTPDQANNSTYGTMEFRRSFTNTTGAAITRLRWRVIDLSSRSGTEGIADLRPRTSGAIVATADRSPCGSGSSIITVQGTALEEPPSQEFGGGWNTSLSSGTVAADEPLPNGATLDLRFVFGVEKRGSFRFALVIEALNEAGGPGASGTFALTGYTDEVGTADLSVTQSDSNDPAASGSDVTYSITATNAGGTAAHAAGVILEGVVPENATFRSFSAPPGWTVTTPPVGGTGSFAAGSGALSRGAAATFNLVVNVNGNFNSGTIANRVTIQGSNTDPDPTNNSDTEATTVTPAPPPTPTPTATPEPTATATPTPAPNRFANISTRLRVESGDNVLIGGFIVTGSSQKRIILRALGPSLPVEGALANPLLEVFDANGQFVAANDNWQEAANAQEVSDSTIPPPNELESAILRNVEPGAYTAVVRDLAGGEGVGLVEVYDLGSAQDSKLANISTRGRVLTGDNVMIGGLIVTGSSSQRAILRALGPSLGIAGQLEDPRLELFDGNGNSIASNNNWKDTQQAEIEATTIAPSNERESAIVTFLAPGAYTAIIGGVDETTGIALVEAYGLQ